MRRNRTHIYVFYIVIAISARAVDHKPIRLMCEEVIQIVFVELFVNCCLTEGYILHTVCKRVILYRFLCEKAIYYFLSSFRIKIRHSRTQNNSDRLGRLQLRGERSRIEGADAHLMDFTPVEGRRAPSGKVLDSERVSARHGNKGGNSWRETRSRKGEGTMRESTSEGGGGGEVRGDHRQNDRSDGLGGRLERVTCPISQG